MNKQSGFSFVELMVAMVVGLVVTGAALQLLITNNRTFALQQATSRVQENGQLVMRFLVRDLRRTGIDQNVAAAGPNGVLFSAAGGIPGSSDGVTDRVTISYHGTTDCEGGGAGGLVQVVNSYFVSSNGLFCNGNLSGGAGIELVSGVEGFKVKYGIDENPDGSLGVTTFVGATNASGYITQDESDAGAPGAVGTVVAVRLALLLSEESETLPDGGGEQTFYLLGNKITKSDADAKAVRRMFTSTVQLRNVDWETL
ncbi:MAG: prepilin-type cleavage/methylation domain-containing protein [Alcanivorax sp.]|nr:MAG: prepilin-type cleavage/methylation domain-containing protein [Alcanivorax sp.]